MAEIITLKKRRKPSIKKKRVAAYCRVSTMKEKQETSYSAQVSYYNQKIHGNPEWVFAGVYSDRGVTGTKLKSRDGFNQMMRACEEGKIDLILTKSIQRFSRNTVDLLNSIRHLKEIGVEVWFERENIRTFSGDGDFMLTILASFAQEESRSMSENLKWSIRKKFENGEVWTKTDCYGYHWDGEMYQIVPDQAVIVRRIFDEFLSGKSMKKIAIDLNKDGCKPLKSDQWSAIAVGRVLRNISHTGNLILQRWYVEDPITKRMQKNKGQKDQYFVPDTHEPIVSLEEWQTVQSRLIEHESSKKWEENDLFSGKVICSKCGSRYYHHNKYWHCSSKDVIWRSADEFESEKCKCPDIPHYALEEGTEAVLGTHDRKAVQEKIEYIRVMENSDLEYHLKNGMTKAYSWTPKKWAFSEEKRRAMSDRYQYRSTNKRAKRNSDLSCFVKCATCMKNFKAKTMSEGRVRFYPQCDHHLPFWDYEVKPLVASVLDLPEFDVNVMDEFLNYATLDGDELTFHFHDGHTEKRSMQNG